MRSVSFSEASGRILLKAHQILLFLYPELSNDANQAQTMAFQIPLGSPALVSRVWLADVSYLLLPPSPC